MVFFLLVIIEKLVILEFVLLVVGMIMKGIVCIVLSFWLKNFIVFVVLIVDLLLIVIIKLVLYLFKILIFVIMFLIGGFGMILLKIVYVFDGLIFFVIVLIILELIINGFVMIKICLFLKLSK